MRNVAHTRDLQFYVAGFKFDLRLYVSVTSYDPLIVYMYEEGMTRCNFQTCYTCVSSKHSKEQDSLCIDDGFYVCIFQWLIISALPLGLPQSNIKIVQRVYGIT